jgi:beta-phosphoglucomutase-like phosphatase (HAD superfamily)
MDTERLWVQCARIVLNRAGHPLTQDEAVALVYGRAWHDIFADMHRRWPTLCRTIEQTSALLGEEMDRLKGQCDIRIHSSIALLRRLAADFPVAVVSGSTRDYIANFMRLGGFADDVSLVIGTEDYPRGKPDPAPYVLAAERLALSPAECLAFEDSAAGVTSAKAAGMLAVALQRREAPAQDLSAADAVYADLDQFDLERFLRDAG